MSDEYKNFLMQADHPWCWWCGRGVESMPSGWFGPWLIERAHIVNNPRREDARAIVLLCSACHRVQHGEQLVVPGSEFLFPTLSNMLWLKRHHDPRRYDRQFLQWNTIRRLPRARRPPVEVMNQYNARRGYR